MSRAVVRTCRTLFQAQAPPQEAGKVVAAQQAEQAGQHQASHAEAEVLAQRAEAINPSQRVSPASARHPQAPQQPTCTQHMHTIHQLDMASTKAGMKLAVRCRGVLAMISTGLLACAKTCLLSTTDALPQYQRHMQQLLCEGHINKFGS